MSLMGYLKFCYLVSKNRTKIITSNAKNSLLMTISPVKKHIYKGRRDVDTAVHKGRQTFILRIWGLWICIDQHFCGFSFVNVLLNLNNQKDRYFVPLGRST
jgi:hypothetical protein